jgi:hypothetical protein
VPVVSVTAPTRLGQQTSSTNRPDEAIGLQLLAHSGSGRVDRTGLESGAERGKLTGFGAPDERPAPKCRCASRPARYRATVRGLYRAKGAVPQSTWCSDSRMLETYR